MLCHLKRRISLWPRSLRKLSGRLPLRNTPQRLHAGDARHGDPQSDAFMIRGTGTLELLRVVAKILCQLNFRPVANLDRQVTSHMPKPRGSCVVEIWLLCDHMNSPGKMVVEDGHLQSFGSARQQRLDPPKSGRMVARFPKIGGDFLAKWLAQIEPKPDFTTLQVDQQFRMDMTRMVMPMMAAIGRFYPVKSLVHVQFLAAVEVLAGSVA